MNIKCDNEASKFILELCDNYLRTHGIAGSEIVNKTMQSLKVDDDNNINKPIEKK